MRGFYIGYPARYAVGAVLNVQQQVNSRAKQSTELFQEELIHSLGNVKRVPIPVSAYRVTISPAAMQKMDASNGTFG